MELIFNSFIYHLSLQACKCYRHNLLKSHIYFKTNEIILAYYFVWPYANLQARALGLSMSSIMLIAGIVPFLAFPASPLLGKYRDKC